MKIPYITIEYAKAAVGTSLAEEWLQSLNRVIDGINAQQESEYITAARARELGAGKAEMFVFNDWLLCGVGCAYISNYMGEPLKYRAIKQAQPVSRNTKYSDSTPKLSVGNSAFEDWFQSQPFATQTGIKQMCCDSYAAGMGDSLFTYATTQAQPEPVDPDDVRIELVVALNSLASDFEIATYSMQKGSEDRANAEGAIAHAMKIHAKHNQNGRIFKNETKPADPHAAIRAEYTKQVKEGTTGFYLWEYKLLISDSWEDVHKPSFFPEYEYRCIDISCLVSKDGEPAIRMLRTEAQKLQRSMGDTVEWRHQNMTIYAGVSLGFSVKGTYTYCTKTTIKLDGRMVTPEQAVAEWEAKKEAHDVWYTRYGQGWLAVDIDRFDAHSKTHRPEYELRPKHPAWTGSRDDVIALLKEEGLL
jgi:hypothetical protein